MAVVLIVRLFSFIAIAVAVILLPILGNILLFINRRPSAVFDLRFVFLVAIFILTLKALLLK